jgi:hypothetical protein
MKPVTGLFAALAALSVISTVVEAADGCGRGWYFNGRRCVPQEGPPGYGPPPPGPPGRYYGPPAGYYEAPAPPGVYYGAPPPPGPQLQLGVGNRDEARYSPPNPAFKTWNNCPPNFTVQDGLCKPYRGR